MINININLKKLEFNTNNAALLTIKSYFNIFKHYDYPSTSQTVLEALRFQIKEKDKLAIISDNTLSANTLIDIIRGASYNDAKNNTLPKKLDYISGNIFLSEFLTLEQNIDLTLGLKNLKYNKKYYLDYFYRHLDYTKYKNIRIRNLIFNYPNIAQKYNSFVSAIFNERFTIMKNIDEIYLWDNDNFLSFFEDHLNNQIFISASNNEKIIKKYFTKILVIEKNKQYFYGSVKQLYNHMHLLNEPKKTKLVMDMDEQEDEENIF